MWVGGTCNSLWWWSHGVFTLVSVLSGTFKKVRTFKAMEYIRNNQIMPINWKFQEILIQI